LQCPLLMYWWQGLNFFVSLLSESTEFPRDIHDLDRGIIA
jgi:hypothetical protein